MDENREDNGLYKMFMDATLAPINAEIKAAEALLKELNRQKPIRERLRALFDQISDADLKKQILDLFREL